MCVCVCAPRVRCAFLRRKKWSRGNKVQWEQRRPQLRLCSQHGLHAVLSEPEKEVAASLGQPRHGSHFNISSALCVGDTLCVCYLLIWPISCAGLEDYVEIFSLHLAAAFNYALHSCRRANAHVIQINSYYNQSLSVQVVFKEKQTNISFIRYFKSHHIACATTLKPP